jgi:hypothetical protein
LHISKEALLLKSILREITMHTRKLLWILILTLIMHPSFAHDNTTANDGIKSGLYFYSHATVDKDKRTGLNLTPDKQFMIHNAFTLTFDFKIRQGEDDYGYIFRVIGNNNVNIDFISNISLDELLIVIGHHTLFTFHTGDIPDFALNKWMNVKLTVNQKYDRLLFSINGIMQTADYNIRGLNKCRIFFGVNNYKQFASVDVPPIVLKNIRIFNERNRMIRFWRLDKHGDGCVFDECEADKASVISPLWEIDSHVNWQKLTTITLPGKHPQIAFDKNNKRIFMAKKNLVYIYYPDTNQTDSLTSTQGIPFNLEINQLLYDAETNRLISYDFNKNHPAIFDFESLKWSNNDDQLPLPWFFHHNKYLDETNQFIYTMGGYGFHYYSALMQRYSIKEQQWQQFDLATSISPRYLASMGLWKDSLLLFFGGYGNISGKQYESPHNYYDLYSINPHTREVRKIWELNNVDKDFTNSNSLVVNHDNNTFYTLSYPNHLYETQILLHEYSLDAPQFQALGKPIPFLFNDIESYCELLKPSDNTELYAVTSYTKGDESAIDIHSIQYPPLHLSGALQIISPDTSDFWSSDLLFWIVVILAVVSGIFLISVIIYRKKVRKDRKTYNKIVEAVKEVADIEPVETANESPPDIYPSVNLLKRFKVVDADNTNITSSFTLTGIQLFLLLYFETIRDKDGITSKEIQYILWPDKDNVSARNNRNVYFNKLRTIFNNVGDIRIDLKKNYWTLHIGDAVFSDYKKVVETITELKKQRQPDKEKLKYVLDIALQGKLLPNYEFEWLDKYKADYSSLLIEYLQTIIGLPHIIDDHKILLAIAEVILLQDSTEEIGIRIKCSTLARLGKASLAMGAYTKYCNEYSLLFSSKPYLSFDDASFYRRDTPPFKT